MVLRGVPDARRLADAATAATSGGMLAPGDVRLVALAARLPRRAALARRAGLPPPPATPAELLARVARHRGVDFAAVAAASERLRAAADGVRRRHVALAEEAGLLWESWAGDDADGVADGVGDVARAAHGVVVTLEEVAARLENAGVTVADAVGTLAGALDELPASGPDPTGPDPTGPDPTGPDPTDTAGQAAVRAWAAGVDAPLHRLLAVLDRTDDTVDRAWAELAAGLAEITAGATTPPDTGPDNGLDLGPVEALLAELVGPVGLPSTGPTEPGRPTAPSGPTGPPDTEPGLRRPR